MPLKCTDSANLQPGERKSGRAKREVSSGEWLIGVGSGLKYMRAERLKVFHVFQVFVSRIVFRTLRGGASIEMWL